MLMSTSERAARTPTEVKGRREGGRGGGRGGGPRGLDLTTTSVINILILLTTFCLSSASASSSAAAASRFRSRNRLLSDCPVVVGGACTNCAQPMFSGGSFRCGYNGGSSYGNGCAVGFSSGGCDTFNDCSKAFSC